MIILFSFSSSFCLLGQSSNYQFGVSLNGASILIGGAATMDFDLLIPSKKMSHIFSLGLGGGYIWTESGNLISLGYKGIAGNKNNHLDFQLCIGALTSISEGNPRILTYPLIGLGYRYQKPSGKFMFRSGISTAGLSLGLGYFFPLKKVHDE